MTHSSSPDEGREQELSRRGPLRTALIYALCGSLWILVTDAVSGTLLAQGASAQWVQTVKGLLYIAATTLLVYVLVRRGVERTVAHVSQLRATRQHIDRILDSLGEAVLVIDPSQRHIVRCNRAAEELFGYWAQDLVGQTTEMLHLDRGAFERFAAEGEPVLDRGETFRAELSMRTRDGHVLRTAHTVTALDEDRGWRHGVVSVIRDITEQERTRDALDRSLEQYRLLADNTIDVIWSLDLELGFTYVNPAIRQVTGHTPTAFIGTRLEEYVDADDLRRFQATVAGPMRAGPGGESFHLELDLLRLDGSQVAVELHGKVVFHDDGRPSHLQGTARDITELRHLEEQMAQARRMESVGQLAGGVAHDFNNMLTVIRGNAQMAQSGVTGNAKLEHRLGEILGATEHAEQITRQLLAFARRQPVAPRILDLHDCIPRMLDMLRRLIGEHVELRWRPGSDPAIVEMDPGQLDQILANLTVNARDAIGSHGKVSIATAAVQLDEAASTRHSEVAPGDYVLLTVVDDGHGMDDATRARIFEPFFTTKQQRGTGLGLATVYGIVRQNEGAIEVDSEPGAGTTFRIYLPRADAEDKQDVPEEAGDEVLGGTETLLVVEDEQALLQLLSAHLSDLGYRVLPAANPAEALALAAGDESIDLLLTDVVMPAMDGLELAQQILQQRPDLRCLYMSGYATEAISDRGLLTTDINLLQKPFALDTLSLRVRETLDRDA